MKAVYEVTTMAMDEDNVMRNFSKYTVLAVSLDDAVKKVKSFTEKNEIHESPDSVKFVCDLDIL